MKPLLGFIRQHPVLSYYILVFTISWGGMLMVIGGFGALVATPEQIVEAHQYVERGHKTGNVAVTVSEFA